MEDIFIRIFSIGITASYIIVAVLILRVLFNKAPKWIACFLWMLVGIRLICPFSLESSFSFIPQGAYTFKPELQVQKNHLWSLAVADAGLAAVEENKVSGSIGGDGYSANGTGRLSYGITGNGNYKAAGKTYGVKGNGVYKEENRSGTGNRTYEGERGDSGSADGSFIKSHIRILTLIWLAGIVAMLSYLFISYMLMRKKVSTATKLRENIYECEFVDSPFILGVMMPRIFIPYHMEEERLVHVLAHENAHLKRKDHILKLAAFLILCIYWFSPLVWLSYILLCRDIELACDERAVNSMEQEEKKAYLLALLECSVSRINGNICPLAFGEVGIKERVIRVKKFKKPPVWLIIIVFIVCVTVSVGFLTSPKKGEGSQGKEYTKDAATMLAGGEGVLNDKALDSEKEDEGLTGEQESIQSEISVGETDYSGFASCYMMKASYRGEYEYIGAVLRLDLGDDPKKGRFSFSYDVLSSYMPYGTYEIKDGKLICSTDDGLYHYVFKIGEDNTMIFMADLSSSIELINDKFGELVTDGAVFYPELDIFDMEDVEVKAVDLSALDFSRDSGADGAQLYYADGKRIVFGGCFGLFVYDRESGNIISSLDLEYINCNYTQGDNYCEIGVSSDGSKVYLQPFAHSDLKSKKELYIFDIEENTLKKTGYDKIIWDDPALDLFRVDYEEGYAKAEYEKDGEERVCILYRGGYGVIWQCSYVDYPKNGEGATQYSPFFKPEDYAKVEEFGAEDIHDIVELIIYSDGVISEIRDADTLRKIEGLLSKAEKTGELVIGDVPGSWPTFNNHPNNGNRFCMFTDPIYIKRSDGVRGIIWPAKDECSVYISGKGFYEMDKGSDRGLWHIIAKYAEEPDRAKSDN